MPRLLVLVLLLGSSLAAADTKLKGKLVTVWEDAELYQAPNSRSTKAQASRPALPRAQRAFLKVKRRGDWIAVQTISTFDTGRLPTCPLPALSNLSVRLWIKARDVVGYIDPAQIPKKRPPAIELQLDSCRNGLANGVIKPNRSDKKTELLAPISALIPYIPSGTKLSWKDGSKAGVARFDVPVPANSFRSGSRTCFEHDLGFGLIQPAPRVDRLLLLCFEREAIRQN